jgi:hypothetical protein
MTAVSVDVDDLFGNVRGVDLAEVMRRASLRNEEGYNYLQVSMPGEDFPMLSVFFNGAYAVVHYLQSLKDSLLFLLGDSSVPPDEKMDFFMPGSAQEFDGEVIVSLATAGEFIKAFATGAPWPGKPGWMEETL